ncbi:response regulator [Ramlibacter sp. MMS24-I3-19]|uniref:response regulator n=1 Tax=Ramlibacter sp. MMS24-I3-19 TaxID=3416606 RepID=UPI003CFDC2BD
MAQERAAASSTDAAARSARSQHTILVVEDDAATRYAAVRLLQAAGFRTIETASGYEALTMADRASAVLLDVNLPDVHGIEVCSLLRARETTARLPVVLTSAVYVDELHREAGLSCGAHAYLVPPLDPVFVTTTLDRLIAAG